MCIIDKRDLYGKNIELRAEKLGIGQLKLGSNNLV